jgi:hypothetical protein
MSGLTQRLTNVDSGNRASVEQSLEGQLREARYRISALEDAVKALQRIITRDGHWLAARAAERDDWAADQLKQGRHT